ncbi:MAG: alpha/beta fold hydrolase [Bryobacterales bacterium]|nr:alpha/beta fold hydrolase [Bryobacterales bacterium]
MRRYRRFAGLILVGAALFAQPAGIEGSWEGALQTPGGGLRIRLHVTRGADGALAGKMDSPDQGAAGIPVSAITFGGGELKWELKMANASYTGRLNEGASQIAGVFTQGREMPLTFKRMSKDQLKPVVRPQEPKPPIPYGSEDVTFASKAAGVTLAGTLTLPNGKGQHPAVVLISGSGPQDRDEALMGHRPFLVLADYLTRAGIAVLRYDDRGVGKSTGAFGKATTQDFADDAEGGLTYLKTRADIAGARVGLAGHSEGGIVAPIVAARRTDVAFIALLAGTGVSGADVILAQVEALAKASGASEEAVKSAHAKQMEYSTIFRESKSEAELEKRLTAAFGDAGKPQLRAALTPWSRYFMLYDPGPTLEKVKCPVLALNGEKDLQVLPEQNLPALEAALRRGGNKDVTIVRLPGLNHLFQTAKTGQPTEYGQIEETMSPTMLEPLAKWIRRHVGLEK